MASSAETAFERVLRYQDDLIGYFTNSHQFAAGDYPRMARRRNNAQNAALHEHLSSVLAAPMVAVHLSFSRHHTAGRCRAGKAR